MGCGKDKDLIHRLRRSPFSNGRRLGGERCCGEAGCCGGWFVVGYGEVAILWLLVRAAATRDVGLSWF